MEILLHTCCAPCASHCLTILSEEYTPILFFSNSNILALEEFEKRLDSVHILANKFKLKVIVDEYRHEDWLSQIAGLEKEPEKGNRCTQCFTFNLKRTAEFARANHIKYFTTSLTVSPHKSFETISSVGQNFPEFIAFDFKKNNGFLNSIKLSDELGLYRQNFCGCEFSMRKV